MWRSIIIFCFTLALAFDGVQAGDLTKKQRTAAKKLYDSKCAKCHRFYEPRDYSQEEWQLWMSKMSKKAKLNPAQGTLLNEFLDEYRAQRTPAKMAGTNPAHGARSVVESRLTQQESPALNQPKSNH
jgi:hypothetical protein